MRNFFVIIMVTILLCQFCSAAGCNANQHKPNTKVGLKAEKTQKDGKLEKILEKLDLTRSMLNSLEARIEYLFIQDPEMLDSRSLQKGNLYYLRDKQKSKLRVNFNTRKQDDDDEQKHVEQYIFDGIWLIRIDHQLEKVDHYQQAPEDKPLDVFEFISHNFPMLGFIETEQLKKNFDIELVENQDGKPGELTQLHLTAKKDSAYSKDYSEIDFWIDAKDHLPARMLSKSQEGDLHDIKILDIKLNKKLKNAVFKVETPKNFSKNVVPLEKN
jgi:outer membrane lipoprotein-sorting protein